LLSKIFGAARTFANSSQLCFVHNCFCFDVIFNVRDQLYFMIFAIKLLFQFDVFHIVAVKHGKVPLTCFRSFFSPRTVLKYVWWTDSLVLTHYPIRY
jgi:hypothetical protein